jgi:hypothetical protein
MKGSVQRDLQSRWSETCLCMTEGVGKEIGGWLAFWCSIRTIPMLVTCSGNESEGLVRKGELTRDIVCCLQTCHLLVQKNRKRKKKKKNMDPKRPLSFSTLIHPIYCSQMLLQF